MRLNKQLLLIAVVAAFTATTFAQAAKYPWDNGKLKVTDNHRFLQHENGTPFFWLGNTGWLASSRLTRDNLDYFFESMKKNGFNVAQISVLHELPFYNVYGQPALPGGFDFKNVGVSPAYGYWDHVDYMVKAAAKRGIYIAMVCVWGGPVNAGKLTEKDAVAYGTFLAHRYKDEPNIIWVIGGDARGDRKTEIWQALAKTIRSIDGNHLMTYHPRGRTCSADWFHDEAWLDLDMFQSGHRRYGQTSGDGEKTVEPDQNEDNWRFVERTYALSNPKPVLDGEPSYEDIPAGLHDGNEPYWQACDVRRYAYWSVFAGSCGHTYGHNSIMQMLTPGVLPAYFAHKTWYEALEDPGYGQMHHLRDLMMALPFTEGVPDQSVIVGDAGKMHDRLVATRGHDYAMVYDYTGREIRIDLDKISGARKNIWWFDPVDGRLKFVETTASGVKSYLPEGGSRPGNDKVLVAIDSTKDHLQKEQVKIPSF